MLLAEHLFSCAYHYRYNVLFCLPFKYLLKLPDVIQDSSDVSANKYSSLREILSTHFFETGYCFYVILNFEAWEEIIQQSLIMQEEDIHLDGKAFFTAH